MKKWMISIVAVGLIFALSACGTKPQASQPAANENTAGGAAGSSASSQEVKLIATNFAFDQKEYKVKKRTRSYLYAGKQRRASRDRH